MKIIEKMQHAIVFTISYDPTKGIINHKVYKEMRRKYWHMHTEHRVDYSNHLHTVK